MGISQRAQDIPPFIVMDVMEKAAELEAKGRSIIHLEVGEPDFDTPQVVVDEAIAALKEGETHYTQACGLMDLRQAVAQHYNQRYGVEVAPGRVLITSGTSPGMLLMFSALLEPGDEVIISDPCYACYDNFISFVGGVPVRVPVEEDAFQYRPEEIQKRMGPSAPRPS
jgi:aspartate/methionine/tyrosine aminotransferase